MPSRRLPHSQYDVNLWRIPLQLSIAAIALFAVTMIPDVLDYYHVIRLPFWLTMGGIDDARAILSATMGCVSTVLALIFSVALLVLSMVATLFGPRLLYRFVQDWVTQTTIGLFMGTFIYLCLVFLVTHQNSHTTFIPQISLLIGWLLVVVSFAFLVYYSHRIAVSIQNPDMVARIVDDFHHALIRARMPGAGEGPGQPVSREEIARQLSDSVPVLTPQSGYLQEVEHAELVRAAARADVVVHLVFRPGQFVLRGEPLARVWPAARGAELVPLIKRHVRLGRHRILKQDSEFGIAQIVEIGIRALSPAVNDTFTGMACVDWAGDALLVLAEEPPFDGCWFDATATMRVRQPAVKFERLVKMAFDQIRQAAADNPAVLLRMLNTIGRIAPRIEDAEARRALLDQTEAIWEVAARSALASRDRQDLEVAWHKVRGPAVVPEPRAPLATRVRA